jgi:hypothetical protein
MVNLYSAELSTVNSIGRANLDAGSISTVHAALFAEQPFYAIIFSILPKCYFRPGISRKSRRIFISSLKTGFYRRELIPLFTSYLARPTTSAFGSIIKNGFFHHLSHLSLLLGEVSGEYSPALANWFCQRAGQL